MNKDLTVGKPSQVLWQFCLPPGSGAFLLRARPISPKPQSCRGRPAQPARASRARRRKTQQATDIKIFRPDR